MKQIKTKQLQKGFTLMEVLLVIVLIGILLTIGLVSLNTEARFIENRNDTRKTHIQIIEGAITQYKLQTGSYPNGLDRTYKEICDPGVTDCTGFVDLKQLLVPNYLQAIPQDPKDIGNTEGAGYEVAIDTTTNTVSVRLKESLREGGVIIAVNDPLPAESTVTANSSLAATVPVTPPPPPSPPPWTPAQITTVLWLDANDASTITLNSSNVSQWNDKSGYARHAVQATAARQPGYNLTTLNSKPGITFDGTLKFLSMSVNISNIILNNSYSAFTVGRANSAPSNSSNGYSNSGFWGDTGGYISNYFRSDNLIGAYNWDGNNDVTTQSYTFGTNVISGVELSSGSIRLRQNGGTETFTASSNTTTTNGVLRIGNVYSDGSPNFTGVVSEVIFFKGSVSTDIRQRIEGYLAHKWGLVVNLPANHPYKNVAPTL